MTEKPSIRLLNAGLSEVDGEIIAQGFFDFEAILKLKVDDYQREFLGRIGSSKKTNLQRALESGVRLPSIVIGMRGQHYSERGDTMYLEDPCYIVDGMQRAYTIKQFLEKHPDRIKDLRIGAEVRFGTSRDTEKELFHALNAYRTAMSGNVILRNMRDENKAILTIYGLSMSDSSSPLYKKVQWNQRMNRGEIITGLMVCHVANGLHSPTGEFGVRGNIERIAAALLERANHTGLKQFRDNIATFFEVMNECFHINKIEYREKATAIKGNFLMSVAKLLAEHANFWNEDKLVISADQKRKLASFPIDDPEIMRLSAAGTMALPILYRLMCDHMNKGKRLNKLHPRVVPVSADVVKFKPRKRAA